MQHFAIVKALARAAIAQPTPALRKQVERLAEALAGAGDAEQAESLRALLAADPKSVEMAPSRLVRSAAELQQGEELTLRSPVPVDRETSTPLADILLIPSLPAAPPIFEAELRAAIESVSEEWKHAEALRDAGIPTVNSLLLHGAPGTGKTQLALWMANELQLPVVRARFDGLMSSFLGTTSRNIGLLFNFASKYRCVLLLDEFDAVAKLRDDPNEMGEIKRVVNTLLQNLDARNAIGFTVGITNHEQLLDPAIWRRFDAQLAIPLPSFAARMAIARSYFGVHNAESIVRMIAWATDGSSGADIEQLCQSFRKRLIMQSVNGQTESPLQSLQSIAPVHSGRLSVDRTRLLRAASDHVVRALQRDAHVGLSRADLGELVGKDATTISRWVKMAHLGE